jgi:uncharacterized protein DUF4386
MKDNTLSKLGGTCSILTGVTIVVTAVLYLLLPAEQQDACGCPEKFLVSMAQSPTLYIVEEGLFGLSSLLAIAAVLAISESVRSAHEGWMRWTSNLAIIGQAVNTIEALHRMVFDPLKAAAYMKGDAAVKAALTVPGAVQGLFDPQGWLRLGAVGLWVLVVSLLALRGGPWPRPLAYVGIGGGIAYVLVVFGQAFQIQLLIAIVAGVGGVILIPLWYIWLGLRLRQVG